MLSDLPAKEKPDALPLAAVLVLNATSAHLME